MSLLLVRILSGVIAVGLFGFALWRARWKSWLAGHLDRQNVWGVGLVVTALISTMRVEAAPGLSLQLLVVTTMTLMHGWALALVAGGIAIAISSLFHGAGQWLSWPDYFLCDVAVPAAFISLLHRELSRRLPRTFVTYFFVTVFAGSIVAFLLSGAARMALLAVSNSLPEAPLLADYAVLLVMMGLAQGTVNGMMMSGAIVFHPEWVSSFDARLYFRR